MSRISQALERARSPVALALLGLLLVALTFRLVGLDVPFQSSDNGELALRSLENSGIKWIFSEKYGLLNALLVKLFAAAFSAVTGASLNEFWWRFPVAVVGALQIPFIYGFLRRFGASTLVAMSGASVTAVFPIHVMQSRYLWGYEAFGLLFFMLAFWKLWDFFESPSESTALWAGVSCGLYLVSHGFIMPSAPSFALLILVVGLRKVLAAYCAHPTAWVIPMMYVPLVTPAVERALDKKSVPDFYFDDHFFGLLGNIGIPIGLLTVAGVIAWLWKGRDRSPLAVLLGAGVIYQLPLMLLAHPQTTVVRGYLLIGPYLLFAGALLALDRHLALSKRAFTWWTTTIVTGLVVVLTGWGVYESIWQRDRGFDPTMALLERGGVPLDRGAKAAGYYVRAHTPTNARVFAGSPYLEATLADYYLDRKHYGYLDKSLDYLRDKMLRRLHKVNVVVADPRLRFDLDGHPEFELSATLVSEGETVMLVYTKGLDAPEVIWDTAEANQWFDDRIMIDAKVWYPKER